MKRKLPLGIQTFRRMREENRYYVDKTAFCWRLVEEGDRYFLSRPRRFGKSLFLDTLKELFEGNEPLFRGLYVHDKWEWSVRYPVVRLSFASGSFRKPDLVDEAATAQLEDIAARAGVANPRAAAPRCVFAACWRRCAIRPGSGWWCSSTSTTSRSWTR